jgi:hypothetical protein
VTGALANPVAWLALRETRIGDRLLNAEQSWFDAATGTPRTGIIASLQASKAEMIQLNLEQADPKACFI